MKVAAAPLGSLTCDFRCAGKVQRAFVTRLVQPKRRLFSLVTLYLNEKMEGKSRRDRFLPQRLFINNFVFLNHCGTNRRRVTDSNLHPLAAGGCGCSLSAIIASNAAEKLCLRLPLRACPARCSHGRRHRNRGPGPGPVRAPGPSAPRTRLRGPEASAPEAG